MQQTWGYEHYIYIYIYIYIYMCVCVCIMSVYQVLIGCGYNMHNL